MKSYKFSEIELSINSTVPYSTKQLAVTLLQHLLGTVILERCNIAAVLLECMEILCCMEITCPCQICIY